MVPITYRHGVNSTEENRVVLKQYHFYISDDRCHGLDFVQHSFQLFYKHLEDNNIQMELHWIWFDGCAGQFKNSCVFQWLCILHKRHKMPHIWNYFENGHRKWKHDGAGACIKTALHKQEMKFTTITLIPDANTIVAWCSSVIGQGARRREEQSSQKEHVHRYFWEVVDVDRSHLYEWNVDKETLLFLLSM